MRDIDANSRNVRIGHEPRVEPALVVGWQIVELLLERGVTLAELRIAETLAEPRRRSHPGAATVGGVKARERKPRLVPEEDQVRLDRKAFLHHALDVVDDSIERAVGEQQQLDAIELAGDLQLEQPLLDRTNRHRAVHRIFVQRIRVEIDDVRARQHHAVVVRLVAIAIEQHDVARLDQRLHDDLVRRRRAVRDPIRSLGAERPRRELLRAFDRPRRLEQRIETARRRRRFGEEHTEAVELDHVLDPVRLQNRFAA